MGIFLDIVILVFLSEGNYYLMTMIDLDLSLSQLGIRWNCCLIDPLRWPLGVNLWDFICKMTSSLLSQHIYGNFYFRWNQFLFSSAALPWIVFAVEPSRMFLLLSSTCMQGTWEGGLGYMFCVWRVDFLGEEMIILFCTDSIFISRIHINLIVLH